MSNPLLADQALPAFDKICPEHVEPAMKTVLEELEAQVSSIEAEAAPSWDSVMKPIEHISHRLHMTWSPVGHFMGVKNSDELRAVYEQVQGQMVTFSMRISQSKKLYDAYCAIRDGSEWSDLDEAQRRIIEINIRDAELSGIALEGDDKEQFNNNQIRLAELSTQFSNHVLDATKSFEMVLTEKDEVAGLPDSALALAAQHAREHGHDDASKENGPWRFTLDFPSFGPFMDYAERRDLRERVYRAFIVRASEGDLNNEPLIREILQLRKQQASLLGYADYAAVSLAAKMAPDVAAVRDLSDKLLDVCRSMADKELQDLKDFAKEKGATEADDLRHWDLNYWAQQLREERYAFNDEELRPYFSLPKVLDGLFALAHRLFGVSIEAADGEAPIWHEDVRYFKIKRENGEDCAAFYLDPYSRPADKRGGAWMNDCVGRGINTDGGTRLPVAHLVCNGTPPVDGKPSLMLFREVETLFHEFGHGLQHMLTTINHAEAAGINNVEWDAVELPSQFMENWCYDKASVDEFARHYETGESIPNELFEKVKAARTYRAASLCLRQLTFGAIDMFLHHDFDPNFDGDFWAEVNNATDAFNILEPLPENRFLCSFGHIFAGGYAAGYYSYKWAEVLSADAFAAFEEVGLDNEAEVKKVGRKYADTVLALGGSKPAAEVYRAFRGRDATVDALLRHNGLIAN